jgi:signal peptide peptidase SppA
MRSLITDLKARRPLLINPTLASDFLERAASLEIPLTAKSSEIGEMLAAVYGAKPVLEKFPPFAVVPVRGVIGRGLSELEKMCGCCDLKSVEEMLEDCERDEAITTIILAIDSPGGTSVGVPELASRIREMSKKVIAFTDNEACSAAYWLGSQASEFYATPSSSVGSVGCFIAYEDESKRYADAGIIVDVIRAGKYKGAGISGTSLTPEQRDMLQGEVLEIWESFKADVKSVREFVDESSLEAQIFSGRKAADLGLVTGLVRGFDEMMEILSPDVAVQMEADESNDERAEGGESEEAKVLSRFASARALGGKLLKALAASPKMKGEGDDEEDDEEKKETEDKDEDTEPKSEEDEGEEKSEDEEKKDDAKSEDDEEEKGEPESDDEEPAKDDEKKDDEEKSEDATDDDKDEKGEPPQPSAEDDEEKKDEPESEEKEKKDDEDLKDEAESGDDAVDTDDKHNKRGAKRSRGRVA